MKAVFLDRDGVINELIYYREAGIIDSPFTVEQFCLLPKVGEAIKLLNQNGLKVIVVSNQPGIAKNHFTEETLEAIDRKMGQELAAQRAFLDRVYYCRHHPQGENAKYRVSCDCRKPKPGLLLQAARDLDIDLSESWIVGDGLIDIKAGKSAGCKTVLLGNVKCELCRLMDEEDARPDVIVSDLLEAARTIVSRLSKKGSSKGRSPFGINTSPSPLKERGIKRVPRKILDFSGCIQGVRFLDKL